MLTSTIHIDDNTWMAAAKIGALKSYFVGRIKFKILSSGIMHTGSMNSLNWRFTMLLTETSQQNS